MRWSGYRSPLLAALVAAALAGCASNVGTGPTPPPTLVTETFTGTITSGSTTFHTFVAKAGQVAVTLQSLSPDGTLKLRVFVGVFSPFYLSCSEVATSTTFAVSNAVPVLGLATATTSMCIQLKDQSPSVIPTGAGESYSIKVEHY